MRKQIFFLFLFLMLVASIYCITIQGKISSNHDTSFHGVITLELQNATDTLPISINTIAHNGYFMEAIDIPEATQAADSVVLKVNGQTFKAQIVNEKAIFDVYLDVNTPEPQNDHQTPIPNIGEITNFTNETSAMELDYYHYAVYSYQNRLLVVNQYSVEEFDRMPDGSLHRLSRFEARMNWFSDVDEDRLYVISRNDVNLRWNLAVYDLSQTPMQKVTSFNLNNVAYDYVAAMQFSNQHIMIASGATTHTLLYDKATFEMVGSITNIGGYRWLKKGNLLAVPKPHSQTPHPEFGTIWTEILEFYHVDEEKNYELTKLSEIFITYYHLITNMEIQNGKLVVSHYEGVIIVDIDDITSPTILHDLWIDYPGFVDYAIYTGDYLYASVLSAYLYVWQIVEDGNMNLIFSEQSGSGASGTDKNMELHYPYLYMNKNYGLKVYDLSGGAPEEAFFHGISISNVSYSLGQNELYVCHWDVNYFLKHDMNATKFDIYSIIENKLVYSVVFDTWRQNVNAVIKDNLLFVSSIRADDIYICNFEIYQINSGEIEFANDFELDHGLNRGFHIIDDLIFFNYGYTQVVYRFVDYELEYVGSFQGMIHLYPTNQPEDFVINLQNSSLIFRDLNNLENILFTKNVPGADMVYFHNDEYLIIADGDRIMTRAYNYHIENDYFSLLHTFPRDRIINTLNGIVVKNAYSDDFFSEFYSIFNGQIYKVGEKDETARMQWHTFFFPEMNKMVQFAYTGVWVYDFEYTVSDKDGTHPISKAHFELMGNYPNPFNPETTIKFNLPYSDNVTIEIFNIRGQKVRRLLDGHMNSGVHSVVWDGKNDAGNATSSGLYFYKMTVESDDFASVKRMILLK